MASMIQQDGSATCGTCPGNPVFSDMPHLLTHITSKGHSNQLFRLRVKADSDSEAAIQLEQYEIWYADAGIQKLLDDRVAARGLNLSRKRKRNRTSKAKTSDANTRHQPGKQDKNLDVDGQSDAGGDSVSEKNKLLLDPRLEGPVTRGSVTRYKFNVAQVLQTQQDATFDADQPPPNQDDGREDSVDLPAPAERNLTDFPAEEYPDEGLESSPSIRAARFKLSRYTDPTIDKAPSPIEPPLAPHYNQNNAAAQENYIQSQGDVNNDDSADAELQVEEVDFSQPTAPETNRLKGVLWPGMNFFDAASDSMKKMRNQKKDDSVIQAMAVMSGSIEQTEMVFSPGGTLHRQRFISGAPEEDIDPMKGESPIMKRRAPRPKAQVLTNVDPNLLMKKSGRSRPKKAKGKQPATRAPARPLASKKFKSVGFGGSKSATSKDDALEEQLIYGRKKKLPKIEIFQDLEEHSRPTGKVEDRNHISFNDQHSVYNLAEPTFAPVTVNEMARSMNPFHGREQRNPFLSVFDRESAPFLDAASRLNSADANFGMTGFSMSSTRYNNILNAGAGAPGSRNPYGAVVETPRYSPNPLMMGFSNLSSDGIFTSPETGRDENKEPVLLSSPDRTISDPEMRVLADVYYPSSE